MVGEGVGKHFTSQWGGSWEKVEKHWTRWWTTLFSKSIWIKQEIKSKSIRRRGFRSSGTLNSYLQVNWLQFVEFELLAIVHNSFHNLFKLKWFGSSLNVLNSIFFQHEIKAYCHDNIFYRWKNDIQVCFGLFLLLDVDKLELNLPEAIYVL